MLLQELYSPILCEAFGLASEGSLWINPQLGEAIGHNDRNAPSHIYILGLHAAEMGLPKEIIHAIPDPTNADDMHLGFNFREWAQGNNFYSSKFHRAAYDNHWVRWYYDKSLDEVGMSGMEEDIRLILFSPEFTQLVKNHLETNQHGLVIVLDSYLNPLSDNFRKKSFGERIYNMMELGKFRREYK